MGKTLSGGKNVRKFSPRFFAGASHGRADKEGAGFVIKIREEKEEAKEEEEEEKEEHFEIFLLGQIRLLLLRRG